MLKYEFSVTPIFPYRNIIFDSVFTWGYTDHRKPIFWHNINSDTDKASQTMW